MRGNLKFFGAAFILAIIATVPGVSHGTTPYAVGFYEAECYSGWWSVSPGCWQPSVDNVFYTPYDYAIGYQIDTGDEYKDGESFTFEWLYPSGYSTRQSATYSESTGCWAGPWAGGTCGRVRFLSWIWSSGKGVGAGTLNVYHNGLPWLTRNYEIKGIAFTKVSGDQDAITESVAPVPLKIQVVDWDGNGFGGKRVEFYATSNIPNRSTGTGVMTSPTGTPSSYISVYTNYSGYAEAYAVLGDQEGTYVFEAFCPEADSHRYVTFTVNATGSASVGVIRMSAIGDVALEGVTDPVYVAGFNPDGSLMETKKDPIAEYPNNDFWLDVELNAFPYKPTWTPQVSYKYRISGLGSSGESSFVGWGAGINISTDARNITSRSFGDHDLKLTYIIKDGGGSTVERQVVTLKLRILPKVEITRPAENEDFSYGTDYISTEVPFNARVVGLTDQQINWDAAVDYQTSGGRYIGRHTETFTSPSGIEQLQRFVSVGGSLRVNATTAINGVTGKSDNVSATITGVAIPDAVITQRLLNLYSGGATPRLMTGIAMVESSYKQFNPNLTIYGRTDKWPNESYDGGSHIGLMQVSTTIARAWNWEVNTQDGVNLFLGNLPISKTHENQDRNLHPTLPPLSLSQHEDNALGYYRLGTSKNNRYWIPSSDFTTWVVNSGNTTVFNYVNNVRGSVR